MRALFLQGVSLSIILVHLSGTSISGQPCQGVTTEINFLNLQTVVLDSFVRLDKSLTGRRGLSSNDS